MRLYTFHRLWVPIHAPHCGTLVLYLSSYPRNPACTQPVSVYTLCLLRHSTPCSVCYFLTRPLLRMQRLQQHPLPLYTKEPHFFCSPHSIWMHASHIYIYKPKWTVPYYSLTVYHCSRIVYSFCFIPFVCHSLCLQQHVILHYALPSYSTFAACFVFATTFMHQMIHHHLFPERREPHNNIYLYII